ncbi:MAG: efflux RND transporter periplasmic adaptor subunit [Prevotella sp.]|nr:efflux RND transporter periplasmic adaptor subunit [Bacteroidaceae bacterium]MBR1415439.1 efflux RND transporter periplasmic adaptor subunit [Prevotella sp.]
MRTTYVMGLLALLVLVGCNKKEESREKAPTSVKTLKVSAQADGSATAPFVGVVEEREATAVSFTGMGVVRRVLVSEGQAVSRGQLLAEMDDTQARNLLSGAEAAMTQANDALERYSLLHDAGSLPEVQWVETQSKVAQAKSQLAVAKKNLADCRLVAPVSGIIGRKMVGAGETALPSQAVVTILDVSSVKVKVAVPEAEVAAITESTSTVVSVEAAGVTMAGGRIEKGIVADALTHTYDIRISVPNSERRLLPGMVASVTFAGTESQQGGQLTVPVTAVQKRTDGSLFVWTVKEGAAHRTPVTIGPTVGNRVAVVEGISDGERIVTEGYQKLSEGTKVAY